MRPITCAGTALLSCAFLLSASRAEQGQKGPGRPAQEVTNSVGMKLRYIQPGEFVMGSAEGEKGREEDESPGHAVRLTKGFYMGATEVTQGQWAKVMGTRPWRGTGTSPRGRSTRRSSSDGWMRARFAGS